MPEKPSRLLVEYAGGAEYGVADWADEALDAEDYEPSEGGLFEIVPVTDVVDYWAAIDAAVDRLRNDEYQFDPEAEVFADYDGVADGGLTTPELTGDVAEGRDLVDIPLEKENSEDGLREGSIDGGVQEVDGRSRDYAEQYADGVPVNMQEDGLAGEHQDVEAEVPRFEADEMRAPEESYAPEEQSQYPDQGKAQTRRSEFYFNEFGDLIAVADHDGREYNYRDIAALSGAEVLAKYDAGLLALQQGESFTLRWRDESQEDEETEFYHVLAFTPLGNGVVEVWQTTDLIPKMLIWPELGENVIDDWDDSGLRNEVTDGLDGGLTPEIQEDDGGVEHELPQGWGDVETDEHELPGDDAGSHFVDRDPGHFEVKPNPAKEVEGRPGGEEVVNKAEDTDDAEVGEVFNMALPRPEFRQPNFMVRPPAEVELADMTVRELNEAVGKKIAFELEHSGEFARPESVQMPGEQMKDGRDIRVVVDRAEVARGGLRGEIVLGGIEDHLGLDDEDGDGTDGGSGLGVGLDVPVGRTDGQAEGTTAPGLVGGQERGVWEDFELVQVDVKAMVAEGDRQVEFVVAENAGQLQPSVHEEVERVGGVVEAEDLVNELNIEDSFVREVVLEVELDGDLEVADRRSEVDVVGLLEDLWTAEQVSVGLAVETSRIGSVEIFEAADELGRLGVEEDVALRVDAEDCESAEVAEVKEEVATEMVEEDLVEDVAQIEAGEVREEVGVRTQLEIKDVYEVAETSAHEQILDVAPKADGQTVGVVAELFVGEAEHADDVGLEGSEEEGILPGEELVRSDVVTVEVHADAVEIGGDEFIDGVVYTDAQRQLMRRRDVVRQQQAQWELIKLGRASGWSGLDMADENDEIYMALKQPVKQKASRRV